MSEDRTILVIGYGSIGQRYAGLLREMGYQVVLFREKAGGNSQGFKEITNWEEIPSLNIEAACITNPTDQHIQTAFKCLQAGIQAILMEKPIDVSDENLDQLIQESEKKQAVIYVAYVLRFHPVIRYLKDYLQTQTIRHVRAVNSSYLPEWRKNTDSYSKYAGQGGGVILDCSHELDYLDYLFGPIEQLTGKAGRISDVTVDAEDYADILMTAKGIPITLSLTYFGRETERTLTVETKTETIRADLIHSRIAIGGQQIKLPTERNDWFRDQLNYFFAQLNNNAMINTLAKAAPLFHKLINFKKVCYDVPF